MYSLDPPISSKIFNFNKFVSSLSVVEEWHREKTNRYFALTNKSKENGWIVSFFAIEVGARGYCSKSTVFCLKQLGFFPKTALKIGSIRRLLLLLKTIPIIVQISASLIPPQ